MPVTRCESNGKWRIGKGECRYSTKEEAVKAYQAILASGELAVNKVSFDYDGVASTDKGKEKIKQLIEEGVAVYIISARRDKESMMAANKIGVPLSRIYATGSNKAKIEKVKSLGIQSHYDNNPDVVNELKGIGKLWQS